MYQLQQYKTLEVKQSKVVDKYALQSKAEKKPLLFVLDSLGMLSTTKEMEDTASGKETRDMTRSQIVKSTFRVLTLKLGKAGIPMIMTNHTYDVIGSMFPQKEMGGGSGLKYAASSIIYLSKRKEKEGTEVVGNIIHCKNFKSRLTKENAMIDVKLTYNMDLTNIMVLLNLLKKQVYLRKYLLDMKCQMEQKYLVRILMMTLRSILQRSIRED